DRINVRECQTREGGTGGLFHCQTQRELGGMPAAGQGSAIAGLRPHCWRTPKFRWVWAGAGFFAAGHRFGRIYGPPYEALRRSATVELSATCLVLVGKRPGQCYSYSVLLL